MTNWLMNARMGNITLNGLWLLVIFFFVWLNRKKISFVREFSKIAFKSNLLILVVEWRRIKSQRRGKQSMNCVEIIERKHFGCSILNDKRWDSSRESVFESIPVLFIERSQDWSDSRIAWETSYAKPNTIWRQIYWILHTRRQTQKHFSVNRCNSDHIFAVFVIHSKIFFALNPQKYGLECVRTLEFDVKVSHKSET